MVKKGEKLWKIVKNGERFYGESGREIGILGIFHHLQKSSKAAKSYFSGRFRRFCATLIFLNFFWLMLKTSRNIYKSRLWIVFNLFSILWSNFLTPHNHHLFLVPNIMWLPLPPFFQYHHFSNTTIFHGLGNNTWPHKRYITCDTL